MATGKLSGKNLRENVLDLLSSRRGEVLVGAGVATDCASIRTEGTMVVHTDPITGATKEIGSLAVKVVLNDIAAGYGEPIALLLTLLLPESMSYEDVKYIMTDAEREAAQWDAEIIGGHTEFTDAVTRPVVNAVGIGKRPLNFTPYKPQIGDSIIVTKNVALEGTFILAEQHEARLNLSKEELDELKRYYALTSVMTEAKVIRESGIYATMHDITEGGVLGAVKELCDITGVGAEIRKDRIPVSELTLKITSALKVNPYRLISSGSMLIVTGSANEAIRALNAKGIDATVIGKVVEGEARLITQEKIEIINVEPDELYRKIGE
ncbi:MAG: hypothetical protein J6V83_05550 [Clostridia bacterium]|nr:hypothetical protein [Clostridia bacterium]MBO7156850.1 hypothetical protein [Clostridia bacterium]